MEEDQEVIDISSTDSENDSWEDEDDLGEETNGFSYNSLYNDSVSDVLDTGHFALVDDPRPSTEYTHRSSPLNRVSDLTGKTRNGSILTSFGQTKDSVSNCKEVFDDNVAAAGMGNGNTQPSTYEGTMPLLKQSATPGNSSEQQAGDFGDCMWRDGIEPSKKHIQRRTLPPSIVPIVHPKGGMHFTVDGDNSSSQQGRGNFSKDSFMASQKTMVPGGEADAQHHDNIYNSDHEPWHATDNKKKRILPSSFHPSISKTVPKPSIENNDDIQILEIYPKLGACGEPKLTKLSNPKLSIKDNIDRRDGHVQIYENAGAHRQLPPWMNGESASRNVAFNSAMSSSSIYADSTRDHSAIGEKSMEEDERLIFQAALMDLAQPKNEIDLPAGLLTVSLLRHQRIALSWMKRKESSLHCTGGILADDQGLGKTVSVIALIQMERPYQVQFSHGFSDFVRYDALNLDEADNTFPEDTKPRPSEKHLEGMSQNGPSSNHSSLTESKFFNLVEIDDEQHALGRDTEEDLEANAKFKSSGLDKHYHPVSKMKETGHSADCNSSKKVPAKSGVKCMMHKGRPTGGTLVVCPATILRQWARELDDKVPDDKKLSVLIYHGSSRSKDPAYIAKHDVVLTTYAIVTNEVPKQPLSIDDDGEERDMENCALSSAFSFQRKRKKISDVHKRGKVKKKGASDSNFDFQSGPLARVRWFRVVLDEAQTIKNFRTLVSRACCGLRAKRRWCLSGTPLQNSLDDLYSYFRFLKYDPFAVYTKFVQSIKNPIIRNATTGYKKLQVILRTIMLRRTKATLIDGEPIINLPPKVICLKKIDFSPDEREFYLNLEADSRQKFKAFTAAGTVNENYASILALLLRLRQACDHPLLVKGYHPGSVASASFKKAQELPRELLTRLLNQLEVSSAICGICSDQPEDAVVTMCGHVFCYQCISGYLCGDDNLCLASSCKETLDANSAFSRATLRKCISGEPAELPSGVVKHLELGFQTSSKIEATMDILRSICKDQCPEAVEGSNERSPSPDGSSMTFMENQTYSNSRTFETKSSKLPPEIPVKAIIFSQWTSMLDMIETSLNCSLIQYRRLDGTMSLPLRDKAVKDFNSDPEVTVMLMSLKAGNLGLNMIAACHVILLDPWWNPTTEDQAIDRAHRIGQTRPVTVTRLTVSETVEDRIFALQEKKREMVSSAFGEDQALGAGRGARLTAEDLRYLFNV